MSHHATYQLSIASEVDTYTHANTHTDVYTITILRNQAQTGLQPACYRQSKQDRVTEASFRHHGDFNAKDTQWYFYGIHECLNKDVKKKKGHYLYIEGQVILIANIANLLDTKYKFYEFNDDLRDTIN